MKKNDVIILISLAIGLIFRIYWIKYPYFIGNDAFLHASVIRQIINTGNTEIYNLSFGSPKILEPLGFYYISLVPAYAIGVRNAMLLMPVIFGLIGIYLLYLTNKQMFGEKVGLISAILLAITLGHIQRTSVNTYRGDCFFLTMFLGSLYFFNKSIKGDWKAAIICGVLTALSGTLWNGYPLGVIIIISGLIISLTFSYIKGINKKDVKTAGALVGSYFGLEYLLTTLGIIKKVFFLKDPLLHLLLSLTPLIIACIYWIFRKSRKSFVVAALLICGMIVITINMNLIKNLIEQSLFENKFFYKVGVSELLTPSFEILFYLINLGLFVMPVGLVVLIYLIIKKKDVKHITYFLWTIITLFLMFKYSRYSFIASVTTTTLTSLALIQIKKLHKRYYWAFILAFMICYGFLTAINMDKIRPRANEYWVNALNWLKNESSGLVVSWWDHGSWIQFYSNMPTGVDSIYGQDIYRIERIAKFLLTDNNDSFKDWGAKYLVLGMDDLFYSGAISKIGNTSFTFTLVGPCEGGICKTQNGQFEIYKNITIFRSGNTIVPIRKLIISTNKVQEIDYNTGVGCLVITPIYNFFFDDKSCNTNYVKLMFGEGKEGYKEIYRNIFVVIYSLE